MTETTELQLKPTVNEVAVEKRHNQHWPALREAGKIDRLNFTDAIKLFNEYVDSEGEGATRPDLAYSNFTRSVYAGFGLNKIQREEVMKGEKRSRDVFDNLQLRYLQFAEITAAAIINDGIAANKPRRLIKDTVRDECRSLGETYGRLANGVFSKEPTQ